MREFQRAVVPSSSPCPAADHHCPRAQRNRPLSLRKPDVMRPGPRCTPPLSTAAVHSGCPPPLG
jgi:hypothetical protein